MVTADPERLPWLGPSRPETPRSVPPPSARRRAQRPLLVVLALFLFTFVGIMSYLAGRGSVPSPVAATPDPPRVARQATVTLPATIQPPPLPPPVETQAPPAPPVRETVAERVVSVPERTPVRAAVERRPARAVKLRPSRRVLAARRALVQPQRVVHASKVVQLGTYRSRRYADAAYRRLVRVYPYLATLPKMVSGTRPPRGYARSYRLQLKAHSPDHARILCQNLLSIGRGCAVLPVSAAK